MAVAISRLLRLIADLWNSKRLVAIEGPYDYIFNLSALKHVRSESDPFHAYAHDYG